MCQRLDDALEERTGAGPADPREPDQQDEAEPVEQDSEDKSQSDPHGQRSFEPRRHYSHSKAARVSSA